MEETQGLGHSQDTSVSHAAPVSSSGSNVPAAQPQSHTSSEERTFRQSEVNALIGRAKNEAVDSYRRMQTEQPQYLEQKFADKNLNSNSQTQTSNNYQEDRIRQLAAEEAKRHVEAVKQEALQKSQDEMAQRTVQNFWNKVIPGREKYEDFDKVTSDIDYARFPNVVQLLGDYLDNSSDVLYELGKDRIKMANLEQLALMSPRDAIIHAQRLSQSIKDNESASKIRLPNEPLSQMRPSNTGTDTGAMSVSDYRKKYKG